MSRSPAHVRVCLVYDCLFPHTVGGAERWYRNLAERLAAEGHEVTYLTLRQWPRGTDPAVPGVRVATAGPRMRLYVAGRRRILPPLVFGAGVLWHLLRHGRCYDVVHTASFPYFSLLAAGATRRRGRFRLIVDWFELWTRDYWTEYLGKLGGWCGWAVQRRCVRVRQEAFCWSRLHERRLVAEGLVGRPTLLEGMYTGPTEPVSERADPEPVVVFAGRHIPEKRAPAIVPALARARERAPELRGEIYGDGPDRPAVLEAIARAGLGDAVRAPGFVAAEQVSAALERATCMVLPSRREGYGLVVVEASARGTPSVVVEDPDNAATQLVDDGVNGVIARSASAEDLANAILRVRDAGAAMRGSTVKWFARNARRLSLESSLERVVAAYGPAPGAPSAHGDARSGELQLSRRFVKLCDRADFDDPGLRARIREIVPGLDPAEEIQRKFWEFAMLTLFLEDIGRLHEGTEALAVGAGREHVLFWLANRLGRVVATDIYGTGSFAAREAADSMLHAPASQAPYPFREDRLEVVAMDGRKLEFPDRSFDVVFTLSSIEHFGGPSDVARAAAEIGRVLRPGGHAVVVTECFVRPHLADSPLVHFGARLATGGRRAAVATPRRRAIDVFTPAELERRIVAPSGLRLMQPLDRTLTPRTWENVTRIRATGELEPATGRPWPHILLRSSGAPWTSVFLALEKPAAAS